MVDVCGSSAHMNRVTPWGSANWWSWIELVFNGFCTKRQCRSRGGDVEKGLPERRDEGPETKSSRRPFTDHKSAQCLASTHYL